MPMAEDREPLRDPQEWSQAKMREFEEEEKQILASARRQVLLLLTVVTLVMLVATALFVPWVQHKATGYGDTFATLPPLMLCGQSTAPLLDAVEAESDRGRFRTVLDAYRCGVVAPASPHCVALFRPDPTTTITYANCTAHDHATHRIRGGRFAFSFSAPHDAASLTLTVAEDGARDGKREFSIACNDEVQSSLRVQRGVVPETEDALTIGANAAHTAATAHLWWWQHAWRYVTAACPSLPSWGRGSDTMAPRAWRRCHLVVDAPGDNSAWSALYNTFVGNQYVWCALFGLGPVEYVLQQQRMRALGAGPGPQHRGFAKTS